MTLPVRTRPFFLPRWLPWCHASLLALTLWFWSASLLSQTNLLGYVYPRDFSSVYVGAQIVAEGRGSQLYNLEVQRSRMDADLLPYRRHILLPYVYPAYVAVLLSPLANLSLSKAFLFWAVLNFVITAWMARRLIWDRFVTRRLRLAVLIAFLTWVPLQLTLSHSQMGLLCALGFTEALTLLEARKFWQAGCWLALGLMKPQLLVLPVLSLVLWRCWRTLASFATVVVIILGLSFAKLGLWITAYLRFLAVFNRGGAQVSVYPTAMQNWRGVVSLLLGSDTGLVAHCLLVLLTIGSIGLAVFVSYPSSRGNSGFQSGLPLDWQARFAVTICLGILASPYLYGHDWVIALPALIVLFSQAERLSSVFDRRERAPTILGWLIAIAPFVSFSVQFGVWPQSTHIQLLPSYMGVLSGIAMLVLRSRPDPNAFAMKSGPVA
jgi:Glycosyltransferase family 87